MKIYLELPLTNIHCDDQGPNGNLTGDYTVNFKTTWRYKFHRRDLTDIKYANFKPNIYRWAYSVIDPKTFHIYQEGE